MEKKTKKKNKKKILALAMVLALIIVIGGTFAWFTSKDEVTNRLSSSSDYNVAITENYTPVENMIPGTTVKKEVAAVNTGSVDAFVKMTVSGQLELTTMDSTGDSTYSATNVSSYVALSTGTNANEVTSLQAGAILAYTTSTNASDKGAVGTLYTDGTGFTPTGSGFYVFARSVTAATSGNTWEYVGYYYDGSSDYYAITIDTSSSTINNDGTISGTAPSCTIDKTTTSVINTSGGTNNIVFTYDSTNSKIVATYDPDISTNSGDEIIFYINLDTDYADDWTVDSNNMTFYYKKILASGATSENLIASVELADSVSESSYVSLNFDLDITLDSIQVSGDTNNLAEAVNADNTWWYAYGDGNGANVTTATNSLTWQSSQYSN